MFTIGNKESIKMADSESMSLGTSNDPGEDPFMDLTDEDLHIRVIEILYVNRFKIIIGTISYFRLFHENTKMFCKFVFLKLW